jgi:Skp family chaperone for outer membrane proteins
MNGQGQPRGRLLEIAYVLLLVVLLCLVVISMGRPRVGVLDAARLAKELGLDRQIAVDAREGEARAREEMQARQEKFNASAAELHQRMVAAADDAERRRIERGILAARDDLQREAALVRERRAAHASEALADLRSRLQPFIDQAARRRRLWIVVERAAGVLYATGQTDITSEVIRAARPSLLKDAAASDATNTAPAAAPEG